MWIAPYSIFNSRERFSGGGDDLERHLELRPVCYSELQHYLTCKLFFRFLFGAENPE
jgi:hypothetical protein